MHMPHERFQPRRVLVKTLGDEPAQISGGQRAKYDISHDRSLVADRVQHPHERMGRAHLVVPVCADQQQVPDLRVSDQVLYQLEGGCIQPLQVVEEERKRVLRLGENAEESTEHSLEPRLSFESGEFRHGHLLADDELELRDEVYDELTI